MQKLYSVCALLLIGLMTSVASAFTITFNVDNPDNVGLEVSYEEQTLQAGDNPVEFMSSYTSVKIFGKNGCKVTALDSDGNAVTTEMSFFSSEAKYGGKTIYITSQTPEEYRTESVKVNIDKASAVKIDVRKSSSDISYYPELTDGDNTIWYEPGVDKIMRIYSSVSAQVPLYDVSVVNGTTEPTALNFVYEIPLPCDGDVVVKGVFPEKSCTVTVDIPEAMEGFVTKITKDKATGEAVDFSSGSFAVNAGTVLYIHGDTEEFLLTSYKVDGEAVSFTTPQRLVVVDKDLTISFEGRPYDKYDITVNVDNPAYVLAKFGTSLNPGATVPLTAGANTVAVNENNPDIFFTTSSAHDYRIAQVSYNGRSVSPNYSGAYCIEGLKADDVIDIKAEELKRDLEAVVYMDDANGDFKLTDSFGTEIRLATGYNHISFCKEDTPFTLSPTGFYNTSAFVYSNDETVRDNGGFGSGRKWSINASNGSVIKIFAVAKEEPEWYTLAFDDNGFGDADITADEIRPIVDRVGFEALAATKISIAPKAGRTISNVTVDGEPVAPADGRYEFAVSGNHHIVIDSAASIADIAADKAGNGVIYNLQGMPVGKNIDMVPAGIYIVDGQKILVK